MNEVYQVLRVFHIAVASIGLLTLLVPLISKKGGSVHKKVGFVFVAAMYATAITGIAIAASFITIPLEVKPPPTALDPAALAAYVAHHRSMGAFLLFTGVLTLNSLTQGMGAISRKHSPEKSARRIDVLMALLTLGGGAMLAVAGLGTASMLDVSFGAIGIFAGTTNLRFALRPLPTRMAWWYQHMRGMITASIAALTAFMVFNASRLTGGALPPSLRIVPWILPAIVGAPLLTLWIRSYRKKFHELGPTKSAYSSGAGEGTLSA